MNADDLVAALETKTGDDLLAELSTRIYRPPLSLLQERLPELPVALRIPMLIVAFDTELHMSGIHGFLENNAGYYLSETIEALAAIGAQATAGTMGRIRAILVRHGIDVADRQGIQNFHWDRWEDSDSLRTEIGAEADNLTYAHARPYEREDVLGLLQRYVEENRAALLHAIRSNASAGGQP